MLALLSKFSVKKGFFYNRKINREKIERAKNNLIVLLNKTKNEDFFVVEEKTIDFRYHISKQSKYVYKIDDNRITKSLCGNTNIMPSNISLDKWGKKSTFLPEFFCEECFNKASEVGVFINQAKSGSVYYKK